MVITDDKELIKYIAAFTYGDGHLHKHGKNCRFQANNIKDNLDYILWRKEILENVSRVTLTERVPTNPPGRVQMKTNTWTHPKYTRVWSRMYHKGRKTIDPHYLKLFDWETLAILYMDDGSLSCTKEEYKNAKYTHYWISIGTLSFSYAENLLLKQTIKDKLGIEFNVRKHGYAKDGTRQYYLRLARSSRDKFIDSVSPYILPSFEYKVRPNGIPLSEGEEIIRTPK